MASLDDLKKRIASVKSTQKITKAMKMVAAAKLRRAQDSAEKGRPYSEKMNNVILNLSNGISDKENAPRLLSGTGSDKIHLCVVMTSDRGLCGGFNTNIIKKAFLIMFVLKPPHKPLSEVITTHKCILSLPVPDNNLGAFSLSDIPLDKFKMTLFIFSEYGRPFSALS